MLSVAINQQYSNSFLLFQHLDSPSPVHVFVNGIQIKRFVLEMMTIFVFRCWCSFRSFNKSFFSVKLFIDVLSYAQVVNRCEILDFPQIREFFIIVFCKQNVIIDNPSNKCDKDRSENN